MAAVIYSRISDDPTGRAAGVERQQYECEALAAAKRVDVIDVVVDNDLSATTGKRRPGFERVLEMVRANQVDTIVVWHTDRLYRLPRDLEPIIDLAEGRRLRFLTVEASEIDLNTPAGRMAARILAAVSANEVEHKAQRQRSASDQRAAQGLPTNRPGYGYRRVDGRDVVDDLEAMVIREAARRLLDAESLRSIAADFERRDIPSPAGAPWQAATLRQLVRRPSLAGRRTHRGRVVGDFAPDVHPAILDADTHDRLIALLDDPARTASPGVGQPAQHLLSGLALCGRCGGRMKRLAPWTPKPGAAGKPMKAAYACGDCHKVRRLQQPVDELVTEILLRRLEREDAAELFTTGDPDAARNARDAIAAVNARLASAADLFAAGAIDAGQLSRITARGRTERDALETTLSAALPPVLPQDALGTHARDSWARYEVERKRAILSALMLVTIMPAGPGTAFNPELIQIEWRTIAETET